MGQITPNMGIYIPAAGETNYDSSFAAGMVNIDQHDHSGGPNKGVPITTSGIADDSITYNLLNANVADTTTGIGTSAVLLNQLIILGLLKNIYQIATVAGFIAKNGSLATARTMTGTANEVNVANGDGSAGNPTFSLPSTLNTYLPVLSFGGASVGITYAAGGQVGKYWRIANMVYFNITMALTSKGSSTGDAKITLPPLTSANDGVYQVCATQAFLNTFPSVGPDVTTYIFSEIPPNSTVLNLVGCGAAVQFPVTDVDFINASEVQISGFYWIA